MKTIWSIEVDGRDMGDAVEEWAEDRGVDVTVHVYGGPVEAMSDGNGRPDVVVYDMGTVGIGGVSDDTYASAVAVTVRRHPGAWVLVYSGLGLQRVRNALALLEKFLDEGEGALVRGMEFEDIDRVLDEVLGGGSC